MKAFLERWRDIEGYDGLYQVSDFGDVRSLKYGKTRVLKAMKDTGGYLYVALSKEGNKKNHLIHRLVAQAFIENPYNLPEVNHIDEDKTNNRVCSGMVNLEWCDHIYNMNYGTLYERSAEAQSEKIVQLTLDYVFVKEWASTRECGRNGFSQGNVSLCCRNKYCSQGNVYKGYLWVKAEDYYKLFT